MFLNRLRWGGVCFTMMVGAAMLAGCGGGGLEKKTTVPLKGKVTHNGSPVTGGELIFAPVGEPGKMSQAGQPGRAKVKSDGTFVVGTYSESDGTVAGQSRVSYMPPPVDTGPHGDAAPESPFSGLIPENANVEVPKAGGSIDINLVPAPKQDGAGQ